MIRASEIKRSLGKIALLFVSMIGSAFLAFLSQMFLGRILPVSEFGTITTALSFFSIAAAITSFGIPGFWLLCFGKEGWNGHRWIKPSIQTIIAILPLVIGLLWLYILIFVENTKLPFVVAWFHGLIIMQVVIDLLGAKLQLEGKYKSLSVWQIAAQLSRLIVVMAAYFFDLLDVIYIAAGFSFASIIISVLALIELKKISFSAFVLSGHGNKPAEISYQKTSIKHVFLEAWPFAATAGLVMLYGRIEVVLLGTLTGVESAGIYSVAIAFLLVAFLIPQAIFQKFLLPKIHRWYNQDMKRFIAVYKFNCAAMLTIGIAGSIIVYLLAEPLVTFVFGNKYLYSAKILSLLSICIVLRFISTCVGSTLISGENMRRKVYCQIVVAFISITVASLCISNFGIQGAIFSKIITELSLMLLYLYASTKHVLGHDAWQGWSLRFEKNA